MTELPLLYAASAGMLATINPCGFAMLPAYISYQLGAQDPSYSSLSLPRRAIRAVSVGLAITAGFITLFSSVGIVIALGGRAIIGLVPWAAVVVGLGLILLGASMLIGRTPRLAIASKLRAPNTVSWSGAFLFGIGYATASLSCTLPVFLVVIGSTLVAQGVGTALLMFLAYSLGMGFVLMAITLGAALFKGAVARTLQPIVPYVERLSAILLVAAGGYIVFYWLSALRIV